ncbi:hypothetical protein QOZ80_1AG0045380 [Eleusine coracana subsp. coracana]|nr:hypothetical protein QOZ80_1AG0045380 [Eleusine coracana subsp. coracana]
MAVKAATMAMLVLAMVVAAAAAMSPPDAVDHQPAAAMSPPDAVDHQPAAAAGTHPHGHGGHHRSRSQEEGDQSPLGKLTRCAGVCGEEVAACMVQCFEPLASGKGNPASTPICLLACTTAVMSCGTSCPNSIFNN